MFGQTSPPIINHAAPESPEPSQPTVSPNEPLKSRYQLLKPSLDGQQDEARLVASRLLQEKKAKAEERARILRQVEEDGLQRCS